MDWLNNLNDMGIKEVVEHAVSQVDSPLEKYITEKLVMLGYEFSKHKEYSFNRGVNVGMSKAYNDVLTKIREVGV